MTPTFLELITTDRHAGTDPGAPGERIAPNDFDYTYDHIDDRKSVTLDAAAPVHYCVNPLSQYDQTRATTAHDTRSLSQNRWTRRKEVNAMRNKTVSTMLLAAVALIAWGDAASAFYAPRLGRWLSRDPIEEEGGLNVFAFLHNGTTAGIDPLGLDRWVVPFPGSAKTTSCLLRYQPLRHDALIYGSGSSCTQVEMGMETCRIQPGIHAVKDIVENVLRACCATTIGCSGRVTKTTVPCPTRPPDRKTTPQEDAELDKKYNDGDTVYYEVWFWNCQNFCKVASNPKFDK